MKITQISYRYGELRSEGFNNVRHEVELSCVIDPNELPRNALAYLQNKCKEIVKYKFEGDVDENDPMNKPAPNPKDDDLPF